MNIFAILYKIKYNQYRNINYGTFEKVNFGGANLRTIRGGINVKRFFLFTAVVILTCTMLVGCQKTFREDKEVTATVTEMQYEKARLTLTMMRVGQSNKLMPKTIPARYYVTISYGDVSEKINNEELYESVKVGDTIQMILADYYDEDNNLLYQKLYLPE